jgi:hypothetical protein
MDRPASIAVRRLELCLVEIKYGILQGKREELQIGQPFHFSRNRERLGLVFADWITRIDGD